MIAFLMLLLLPVTHSWNLFQPALAPKVCGHGCCNVGSDKLLLFGGLKEDRTATNELWLYEKKKWELMIPSEKGPGPRMYVGMAFLNSKVYVMGGWDPEAKGSGGSFKDEIWSLNPATLEWAQCGKLPCGPISRHTAVKVGDSIIMHTFKPGDEGVVVLRDDGTCHAQATSGDAPEGLSMCTAAALTDHEMIIFGGSTKTQQMSNDVYVLDTKTWVWTKLQATGSIPPPRASSSMARIDDRSAIVFGGAGLRPEGYGGGAGLMGSDETYVLSLQDDGAAEWSWVNVDSPPRARIAASLNYMSENEVLLTGGWDPSTTEMFDDACTLKL